MPSCSPLGTTRPTSATRRRARARESSGVGPVAGKLAIGEITAGQWHHGRGQRGRGRPPLSVREGERELSEKDLFLFGFSEIANK
jgi:hypothetical protein